MNLRVQSYIRELRRLQDAHEGVEELVKTVSTKRQDAAGAGEHLRLYHAAMDATYKPAYRRPPRG